MNNTIDTEEIRGLLEEADALCTCPARGIILEIISLLPPPCERCGGSGHYYCPVHGTNSCPSSGIGCKGDIVYCPACQAPAGIIEEFVDNMQEQCKTHKGLNRVESRAKSGDYLAMKLLQACTHLEQQAKEIKQKEKEE